jgi:hypothetical protein
VKLTAATLVAALLLAGCAGTSPAPPNSFGTATPIPHASTFASAALRFSVSFDTSKLRLATDPGNVPAAEQDGLLQVNLFGDRGGVTVLVQRMGLKSVSPPPLAAMEAQLTGKTPYADLAPSFVRRGFKALRVTNVGPSALGGARGYRATYLWATGSGAYYVLFTGPFVYRIEAEASSKTASALWPTLNAALNSFTVTP